VTLLPSVVVVVVVEVVGEVAAEVEVVVVVGVTIPQMTAVSAAEVVGIKNDDDDVSASTSCSCSFCFFRNFSCAAASLRECGVVAGPKNLGGDVKVGSCPLLMTGVPVTLQTLTVVFDCLPETETTCVVVVVRDAGLQSILTPSFS